MEAMGIQRQASQVMRFEFEAYGWREGRISMEARLVRFSLHAGSGSREVHDPESAGFL